MTRNAATANGPGANSKARRAWPRRGYRLFVEELEPRVVPAPITSANWIDLGPQPQTQGQVVYPYQSPNWGFFGSLVTNYDTSAPEPFSGRITSLALSSNIGPDSNGQARGSALFVGSAVGDWCVRSRLLATGAMKQSSGTGQRARCSSNPG